ELVDASSAARIAHAAAPAGPLYDHLEHVFAHGVALCIAAIHKGAPFTGCSWRNFGKHEGRGRKNHGVAFHQTQRWHGFGPRLGRLDQEEAERAQSARAEDRARAYDSHGAKARG